MKRDREEKVTERERQTDRKVRLVTNTFTTNSRQIDPY